MRPGVAFALASPPIDCAGVACEHCTRAPDGEWQEQGEDRHEGTRLYAVVR